MAPMLSQRALDGSEANVDPLGISYVVVAIVYTLFLASELYLLFRHRSAFCVRIRNLKVIFAAVIMLHIYLVLVLLVYPWNGLFPCAAEFWIMSVFLPLGMAFFQVCNAKVLTVYETQRRLTRNFLESSRKKRTTYTPRGLWEAWTDLDAARQVYIGTIVGLVLTLVLALILFVGSRSFHPSVGFFGEPKGYLACRRGGEWAPSILVQLFWSVCVGPWILWKIRHIKDVHSWAWQTRLAIIAGLPGTPLWIAFTYSDLPLILDINKYFVPAGWFLPSLVVCQQVLILIPLRDARRSQPCDQVTSTSETASLTSNYTSTSSKSLTAVHSKELKSKTSMQALEFSIEHSIEPLIAWAAAREFTAENTIFLREVRNFKKKWSSLKVVTTAQRRQMFTEASLIYFALVNPFTAETAINIEYKIFKTLQNIFATVEFDPYQPRSLTPDVKTPVARDNVVCPWEDTLSRPASMGSNHTSSSTSSTRSIVPSEFTDEVFDAAFESIKYLVFTNTWPRYVELAGKLPPSFTNP
ncbi:hypothetical protein ACN47E_006124 [Coniothyrium glycines]